MRHSLDGVHYGAGEVVSGVRLVLRARAVVGSLVEPWRG